MKRYWLAAIMGLIVITFSRLANANCENDRLSEFIEKNDTSNIGHLIEKCNAFENGPHTLSSALRLAISKGRFTVFSYFTSLGADLKARDTDGNSLLQLAIMSRPESSKAKSGRRKIISFFLDRGDDLDVHGPSKPPLILAIEAQDLWTVQRLVELGAPLDFFSHGVYWAAIDTARSVCQNYPYESRAREVLAYIWTLQAALKEGTDAALFDFFTPDRAVAETRWRELPLEMIRQIQDYFSSAGLFTD